MRVSFIHQIFFGYLLYEKHSSRHKGHSNEKRQKVLPPWTLHSSRNVPFKFPFGNGLHYITKRGWFKKSPEEIIEIPGRCSERGLEYPQKAEKKFPFRGNKYKLDLRKHTVRTGREAAGGGRGGSVLGTGKKTFLEGSRSGGAMGKARAGGRRGHSVRAQSPLGT